MEVVILFIIPLTLYVLVKLSFLREKDPITDDLEKYKKGFVLMANGFIEEALYYFTFAAQKHPKSSVIHFMVGKCQFLLRNYYSAIICFDKAASYTNKLPEVFFLKGKSLFFIEEYEKAIKEFNKTIWFYRENKADAFYWRSHTYKKLGNKTMANQDLKKSLEIKKDNIPYYEAKIKVLTKTLTSYN